MDDLSHPADALPPKGPSRFFLRLAACIFAALLVAVFYFIENVRGASAWRAHRQALAAKGEIIDWRAFVPPAPPANSNMMSAGNLAAWFIRRGANTTGAVSFHPPQKTRADQKPAPIGFIKIDPNAPYTFEQLMVGGEVQARLLDDLVGPRETAPSGHVLFIQPSPAREIRLAGTPPAVPARAPAATGAQFNLEPAGANTFAIFPQSLWWDATAYLADSQQIVDDLRAVRAAAARPVVWLEGDYTQPDKIPVHNYVALRTAAQTAGARAQAHLLLKRPAEALDDLLYVDNLLRITESRPTTLVAIMMGVAIKGVAVGIIESAFARGAWSEKELAALLANNSDPHFIRNVAESLRGERAAIHALVRQKGSIFVLMDPEEEQKKPWIKRKSFLANLMPAGWTDSGLVLYSTMMQQGIEGVGGGNGPIIPHMLRDYGMQVEKIAAGIHPRRILTAVAVPNVGKAAERAAFIETKTAFVRLAAALELHRLKKGAYPATLSELVPQYLAELPKDVVTGKPLLYRRLGASYVLYSTGWNRYDDLGPLLDRAESDARALPFVSNPDYDDDWVWRGAPPFAPNVSDAKR